MKAKLFLFLVGALIGVLVAILFRPVFQPLVSEILRDESDRTEGRVVGKRLQGERLLLTVDAAEGTILATFQKRVEEIDMLVEEGDLVTLGVPRYEPFVEDPPVLAVRKQEPPTALSEGRAAPAEPVVEGMEDDGDAARSPGEIVPERGEPDGPPPSDPAVQEEEPDAEEAEAEAEPEPPPAA